MKKRYWLLILLGVVGLLLVLAFLVLFSRPVQTALVNRALESINRDLNGSLEIGTVHLRPSGVFYITEASLMGDGEPIVQVKGVHGRIHLFSLLNKSLDFDSLVVEGLQAEVEIDSSGHLALEDVFAKPPSEKLTTEPTKPWCAHTKRFEVSSEMLKVQQEEDTLFQTDWLHISAALSLQPAELVVHKFEMESHGISLRAQGSLPLAEEEPGAGVATLSVTTQKLRPFLITPASVDTIQAVLRYELQDSLDIHIALQWPQAGVLTAAASLAWPVEQFSGSMKGSFFGLQPDYLMSSIESPMWLCGDFDFQGKGSSLETADIAGHLSFRNSHYDKYRIHRADFNFDWREMSLSSAGEIHSASGSAIMTLRGAELLTASPRIEGNATIGDLRVQDFIATAPEDIPRLSGWIRGRLDGIPPSGAGGEIEAALAPTTYRGHAVDTIVVQAYWEGDALTLSNLYAAYEGISLEASGNGIFDSTFQLHTDIQILDAGELTSKLPISSDLAQTIAGTIWISADAEFRLNKEGISGLRTSGRLRGESLAAGPCTVSRVSATVDSFGFSPLFARGKVAILNGRFSSHSVDTMTLFFTGTPENLSVQLEVSRAHDSLRLQLEGVFEQDTAEYIADLKLLEAEALGYVWTLQKPTRVSLRKTHLFLTDFNLASDVGALHAVGKLDTDGEQEFTLDISNFQCGTLRQILPIPEARVSSKLQLSGPAQSVVAQFEVLAESLRWSENGWIDKFVATGKLQGESLRANGFAIWLKDTLAEFKGILPIRFSLSEGPDLPRDKPIVGYLRVHKQPLPKLQSLLPWGVTVGGSANAEVNISGTIEQPIWRGNFAIENGSIEDVVHGLRYRKISLNGTWRGDTLLVKRAEAKAIGKAEASGSALMALPLPKTLTLRANFKKFQIINRADLRAKMSGDIEIKGPLLGLQTKGDITLDEMRYRITSASTKSIEPIDLESELAELRGDRTAAFRIPGTLIYEKMDQAVRVSLPRNCWVHGGGVSIQLEGDVWFYKPPDEAAQVYGQIRVVRGTVNLYARELAVQEGTVTFDGDLQDPNLNITAIEMNLKRSRNVEIILRLQGTKNHPEIELSGRDPDGELSYADIVSYLTLGRRAPGTGGVLSSDDETTGTPALGMAAKGASAGISRIVSQALHLDVFKYRPGQGGVAGLTQGELEVGAYVTDNLFVSIIQSVEESQTGQEVILEYQVLPWLRLRGTRQTEGNSAFDLSFQWEWR